MPDDLTARVAALEHRAEAREVYVRRVVRRAYLVVLVVVLVSTWGTWRAEQAGHRSEQASARVASESVERQVSACSSTNEFRRLFRQYLSGQSRGVSPAQALELPGFANLDPSAQAYVRSLVDLVNAGAVDAGRALDEYERNFPIVDCELLRRQLVAVTGDEG